MPVPVRLRLARHGHRHNPVFHLVAINSQKPRNAQPIETLGEYDPVPRVASTSALPRSSQVFGEKKTGPVPKEKRVEWDVGRINYWLGVGAQPTKSVVRLLERGGVLTTPHKWQHRYSPAPTSTLSSLSSLSTRPSTATSSTTSKSAPDAASKSAADALNAKTTGFEGKTAT